MLPRLQVRSWSRWTVNAGVMTLLIAAAGHLHGQMSPPPPPPTHPGPPGPQGSPNGYADTNCYAGGSYICRTCAMGTGYTCASPGPTPTPTGGRWWVGSCQDGPGPGCQHQSWDCGANYTCGPKPKQVGNCSTFVVCAEF